MRQAKRKRSRPIQFGNGEKVLLISGVPQRRRSWNRLISLLSTKFQTVGNSCQVLGETPFSLLKASFPVLPTIRPKLVKVGNQCIALVLPV